MLEITRTATFTDDQPDEALTTIVARSVLEAALAEDERAALVRDRERGRSTLVAIDLSTADLEELLRLSGSDDVALTLDGDDVEGLFDDPDVEGHGLKGAIAIAVTSAALLAPAGQAAVTQSVGTQRRRSAPVSRRRRRSEPRCRPRCRRRLRRLRSRASRRSSRRATQRSSGASSFSAADSRGKCGRRLAPSQDRASRAPRSGCSPHD